MSYVDPVSVESVCWINSRKEGRNPRDKTHQSLYNAFGACTSPWLQVQSVSMGSNKEIHSKDLCRSFVDIRPYCRYGTYNTTKINK